MALIKLEGMAFYAYHGCFSEEQIIGNKFVVDVTFECETAEAEKHDILSNTVDYQEVYNVIRNEMGIKSKLLEHVGRRIVTAIEKDFPSIKNIRVKISKCHPPIGGKVDRVSVEVGSD